MTSVNYRVLLEPLEPGSSHSPSPLNLLLTPGVEVLVGRLNTCHVQLAIPTISSIHLSVLTDATSMMTVTDHSTNGVFINGIRLHKRQPHVISGANPASNSFEFEKRQFRFCSFQFVSWWCSDPSEGFTKLSGVRVSPIICWISHLCCWSEEASRWRWDHYWQKSHDGLWARARTGMRSIRHCSRGS